MKKGTESWGPGVPREWQLRRYAEQRTRRAGVSVAAFSLAVGVYTSNPLLVRHVRLEGNCSLPPATVRKHTDALLGQHWLVARLTPVQRRLLRLPSVKQATLLRWPVGEITVRMEERKPYATLATPAERLLVDPEGVVFRGPDEQASRCPVLAVTKWRGLKTGAQLAEPDMRQVRDCLEGARQAGLPEPRKLVLDSSGAATLYTDGPLCIRLGRQDLQQKLLLADCAVDSLREQGKQVRSLDLRTLEACTWSPHLS